jgi:spermidine synthase
MSDVRTNPAANWSMWMLAAIVLLAACQPAAAQQVTPYGKLEHDVKSDFSHIRIRRRDDFRSMMFVRDTQEEVVESMLDLAHPNRLVVPYTQFMFLSYAFRPEQERVLIVGLGGGSMVHFLKKFDPELKVDVVEIDPAVVDIARRFFGVTTGGNVKIITADAFKYLAGETPKYDVIYMDAFLKPSEETDSTGKPLNLNTVQFYRDLQTHLTKDGVVVFNLNNHRGLREDLATMREAFPNVYPFVLPENTGLVVVASTAAAPQSPADMLKQARQLDARPNGTFSFEQLARRLARGR